MYIDNFFKKFKFIKILCPLNWQLVFIQYRNFKQNLKILNDQFSLSSLGKKVLWSPYKTIKIIILKFDIDLRIQFFWVLTKRRRNISLKEKNFRSEVRYPRWIKPWSSYFQLVAISGFTLTFMKKNKILSVLLSPLGLFVDWLPYDGVLV